MGFTYKGLTAELQRHIITDAEVDRHLQQLQQQNPRIAVITDRPTQRGDEVVLDYAGFCNGEQFAGGTAQKQTLTLGSGTFIPGFEDQLLDKVPGEEVTVKVTFPKEYHAAELAGKDAEFRCTIHEIREKTAYELDDVFAREVGECENLDQMRQKLRQSLQSYTDERGEMDLQDRLLRQAAATLEFTVTEDQIRQAVEDQMQNLNAQLSQQGLTLDMYCSFLNTTEETLRQDFRSEAEQNVRVQAAIELITELEGLDVDQDELAQAFALVCRQNNMTMEQLKPYYNAEFEHAVVKSVLTSKVMRLIRDAAHVVEV